MAKHTSKARIAKTNADRTARLAKSAAARLAKTKAAQAARRAKDLALAKKLDDERKARIAKSNTNKN